MEDLIIKIIDAIAEDLSKNYESPIRHNMWFTDDESAIRYNKKMWIKYLEKIADKAKNHVS